MGKKVRQKIKSILPPSILMPLKIFLSTNRRLKNAEENLQKLIILQNKKPERNLRQKQVLKNSEYKIYSQNGEDGILNYIFSKIGTTNKKFIEFGIEDGRQCNSANLLINNGWSGLFIEGDKKEVANARHYYHKMLNLKSSKIKIACSFITKENINEIFKENSIQGEIDFLSVDIDGNDYYVWQAINTVKPRVVAIEYNSYFGPEKSITVKYDSAFDRYKKHSSGKYFGASLSALTKLAKTKGYILIGCESRGANAFFVRKDVAKGKLTEISVKEAYYPRKEFASIKETIKEFEKIRHLDFEKI